MESLSSGQLAAAAGVNLQTIRYYERRGLLPSPPRTDSGYRRYGTEDVARLRFIRRAQSLGFTLGEIGDLLELRGASGATAHDVHLRVRSKVADVDGKIADLRRIRAALTHLAGACNERGGLGDCRFLEALEAQDANA